ncbi:MAG: PilW family protein, partial [Rhodanobacteraceae bacterium]
MNTLHANRRSLSLARRHATGFTLVELMVAMVLGLIVIAGVTSVFLAGQQSFRTNGALADVQDSSRIAFELMARDIRQAGLTGCNSTNDRIADILNNQSTAWWADWNNVIAGYDNAAVDPAVTSLAAPNAVAGTSSLELIGAGVDPSQTTAMYDGTTPAVTLALPAPDLAAGDVVMVCTPGHAALFQT